MSACTDLAAKLEQGLFEFFNLLVILLCYFLLLFQR
jgi:hypothetical protein